MKFYYSPTALFAAALPLLTPLHAAPKPDTPPWQKQAEAIFERIDQQARDVSDTAFRLREASRSNAGRQLQAHGLDVIRKDVNDIAGELKVLEDRRDSLPG